MIKNPVARDGTAAGTVSNQRLDSGTANKPAGQSSRTGAMSLSKLASRYEGEVLIVKLSPIPALFDVEELTLTEALSQGGLFENDAMAEYALEGVNAFMRRNKDWKRDHAGALCLYSLEYPSREKAFYYIVNKLLRDDDRTKLTPHLPVLKLQSIAISKLHA